jgi:hypothetical protein
LMLYSESSTNKNVLWNVFLYRVWTLKKIRIEESNCFSFQVSPHRESETVVKAFQFVILWMNFKWYGKLY